MSGETDVLTRLLSYHDHISVPPIQVDQDVRRGRRRVRRNRTVLTGGVALGVAGVVVAVSLLTGGARDTRPQPANPTPTPSTPLPANGRIISPHAYFGNNAIDDDEWRGYDPVSDTAVFVARPTCPPDCVQSNGGITVIGRNGPLAQLTCGGAIACRRADNYQGIAAALGPGPRELTIASGGRVAQVVGYDGRIRRTVDLTSSLAPGEGIRRLAWSAGGRRLAALTGQRTGGASVSRVWIVDQDSGSRLAYSLYQRTSLADRALPFTLRKRDFDGVGYVQGLGGWSPDGRVLALDVMSLEDGREGARVVALTLVPTAGARPATVRTLYYSDRNFDWAGSVAWSPDGTRLAVRTSTDVVEISAVDGRLLARRPDVDGWLLWARAGR
jgi:hypothetical protein